MNIKSQQIEALLLTAGEAVSLKELAQLTNEPLANIPAYLQEISEGLAGHGLVLVTTDKDAQLTTSPAVGEFLTTFNQEERRPLSKAAAEVLSIVAYRGPIARHEIDVLRGVDSRAALRQLQSRGLIGQSRSTGGGYVYDLNIDFLIQLGISSREQLPDYERLSNHERLIQLLANKQ